MTSFLSGSDWLQTPLSAAQSWPQGLKAVLATVLNAPLPMALFWGPERALLCNDSFAAILGRHPSAIQGRPASIAWPEAWARVAAAVDAVFSNGQAVTLQRESLRVTRDGQTEEAWFTWSFSPVRDEAGSVAGVLHVAIEDTARVRADEMRRTIEMRLQRLIEHSPQSTQLMYPDGRVREVNNAFVRLFGITLDQLRDYNMLRDPGLIQTGAMAIIERAFAGEAVTVPPIPYVPDRGQYAGQTRWAGASVYPVKDDAGRVEEVVLVHHDVTEQRQAEEALRTSEERFRLMANAAPQIMWVTDTEGRAQFLNQQWTEYTGAPAASSAAEISQQFLHPEDGPPTMAAFDEARRTGGTFRVEHRIRSATGEYRWFLVRGEPYRDPRSGEITQWFGASMDIHDRKQAEEALRHERERLRAVFEQTQAGIAQADLSGRFMMMNARYCEIVGRTRDELLQLRMQDITHPADLPRNLLLYERAIREGTPFLIEKRYIRPDGAEVWVSNSVSVMRGTDGKPAGVIAATVDITDRKRIEEQLKTSEERLALSITSSELGTFYCPLPFGKLEWNETCKAHFWLPPDANVDLDLFYSILHPEDREHTRQALDRAIYGREPFDAEYRTVAPDGRQRWIRAKGRAYYDSDGTPVRIDGVTLDITDRKRAENILRESEQRFRNMADTAPAMLWVTEPNGYCSFLSRGWYDFTGQTAEEGLGFGWTNAAHPDDREAAREAFVNATRTRSYYEVDFRARRADGEYRWVIDAGRPRFGADGEFLGFIGSVIDITDRKRAEAERQASLESERAARTEAEHASRMKDEFLATLSHELRTPLSAILGWSQILTRGNARPETLREGLATIERNARAQTQIIEDLLDMSRIISGKISLSLTRSDLCDAVRAAIDTVRATAAAKEVEILYSDFVGSRCPVLGDLNRLQQVFWNLLSNAIKFTPRGGNVEVRLERRHSQWQVDITDTGEGISPEFVPYVFDRFRQADASTTRRHGGLGLGLAIVKQLVELHGGKVRVQSEGVGKGAKFTVSLPVSVMHLEAESRPGKTAETTSSPSTSAPSAPLQEEMNWDASLAEGVRGARVLVVDDEPDARTLLQRLFEDCGCTVLLATTAHEAFEKLQTERPDLLVSDISMPERDGYDLIRRVRQLSPDRGGQTPAIALTAYARAEDRMKAVRAGFQMHVPKPVEPAELMTMVASLIGRSRSE